MRCRRDRQMNRDRRSSLLPLRERREKSLRRIGLWRVLIRNRVVGRGAGLAAMGTGRGVGMRTDGRSEGMREGIGGGIGEMTGGMDTDRERDRENGKETGIGTRIGKGIEEEVIVMIGEGDYSTWRGNMALQECSNMYFKAGMLQSSNTMTIINASVYCSTPGSHLILLCYTMFAIITPPPSQHKSLEYYHPQSLITPPTFILQPNISPQATYQYLLKSHCTGLSSLHILSCKA